ncbi:DUF5994 family protein [Streptomyces sp. Je 1-369]|uniref:DUF5994 family protein n=1 Tax=Streptomyces sp. Je 1-369 TaxID=2966192 RepID=UPI00228678E9|nr:DUF5994 family protein [Streptomyces sp. Je 1-369]WAL98390.1 DUF5994 family protein [Streptomyces sp. Je 1-369]
MATVQERPLPSYPLLRLCLAPEGGLPRAIDGAWWPRSFDVVSELPQLFVGLPAAWRDIRSVTVKGSMWHAMPGRMLVANQVVRLHRSPTASAQHMIVLLSPGRGRWDLLVVPPDTPAKAAALIMSSAAAGDLTAPASNVPPPVRLSAAVEAPPVGGTVCAPAESTAGTPA